MYAVVNPYLCAAMSASKKRIAILGTGPISLLKASLAAAQVPQVEVVIFDKRNEIGGAWYSDKSPKGDEIECGCHIWSYCPEVYRFIERELGIPLLPYRPPARFIGAIFKLPYSVKNTMDTYRALLRNICLLKWGRVGAMRRNPAVNFRIFGKRNLYPRTGSPELVRCLSDRLTQRDNVKFRTNCPVDKIDVSTQLSVHTAEGIEHFDEVFLSSVTELKEITSASGSLVIPSRRLDYVHLLMESNKPLKRKISYWRLMTDPMIHRITDISYQTKHCENLYLVGIKPDAFIRRSEAELEKHCSDLFTRSGLTDESHTLKRIKTHVFPTYYIDEKVRENINQLHPKLRLLHSTDLMHGFYYLLKEEGII